MRKYISIIFGAFLLSLAACTEEIVDPNVVIGEGNRVILSLTSPGVNVTRSADTDVESALALIDVYIMDKDYNFVYTERIDNTASPVSGEGEFTLGKGRDEFDANKEYFVYIVANSTVEMADDWAELKSLTQKNSNVHLSGMNITNVASGDFPPKFFLMDGFAYVGDREPEDMSTLVINDSSTDDTVLKATLYRAAAKLIINITQGESVQFHQSLEGAGPLFSFYQLPISTLVVNPSLTAGRHVSEKQTTVEWGLSNNNFHWNTDKNGKPVLTLVGYAYANDWSGNNNATNETALLLSVPMTWDSNDDGTPDKDSPVNWYKVPVSKNEKLERNKCYVINVSINAVGAEEINVPLELKDIEYVTLDWQEVEVEIGENEARYLTLNTDLVKIYDSNFDLDQLTFTSSSPIKSIKLKDVFNHHDETDEISALELTKESDGETEAEYAAGDGVYAYYVDKFGKKVQLGTDPGFDINVVEKPGLSKDQILALENNLYAKNGVEKQYIRAEIPEEYERALNGDIHVYSPINVVEDNEELNWNSHFNTVRYLEFEVMNEQGLTAVFRVEQYPVTVIRNLEGFFSYRSDFHIGDDPVYHNPTDWITPVSYNNLVYGKDKLPPVAEREVIVNEYGRDNPPTSKTPAHFLKPTVPMFSLAGFSAYHVEEVTQDGKIVSSCATKYQFEEALYGNMPRNYYRTWGDGKGTFHRGHYYTSGGSHFNSSSMWYEGKNNFGKSKASAYYQALGHTYEVQEGGQSKYYKHHHTGNFFETFSSKVVRQVYKTDPNLVVPMVQKTLICDVCTKDKSINTAGSLYIPASECVDKDAHKANFTYVYVKIADKKVTQGMAEIHRIMATGEGEEWANTTSFNPYYITSISDDTTDPTKKWTYKTSIVPGAVFHNHRMYYIRVNATSTEYTVAVPRMMDEKGVITEDRERGYTMESPDNAQTISPSFMVASQLGESIIPENEAHYVMPGIKTIYDLAKNQCREYVETRYDDVNGNGQYDTGEPVYHYDDWRLPTRAEIEYIVKHQETSRAMDKVLYAQYYFHSSDAYGQYTEESLLSDEIPQYQDMGWYMRCVRDAFREPKPEYYNE